MRVASHLRARIMRSIICFPVTGKLALSSGLPMLGKLPLPQARFTIGVGRAKRLSRSRMAVRWASIFFLSAAPRRICTRVRLSWTKSRMLRRWAWAFSMAGSPLLPLSLKIRVNIAAGSFSEGTGMLGPAEIMRLNGSGPASVEVQTPNSSEGNLVSLPIFRAMY
jgi:hypothetical protein